MLAITSARAASDRLQHRRHRRLISKTVTQSEVIKYSAGGFRDFTRIAASDPTMWRDIFLNNKDAVLEMLGRFNEDLTALQRAIRRGDGDALETLFIRTRAIRQGIIEAARTPSNRTLAARMGSPVPRPNPAPAQQKRK